MMYFSWRDILIIIAVIVVIFYLTFLAMEGGLVKNIYLHQLIVGLLIGWQVVFYYIFRSKK